MRPVTIIGAGMAGLLAANMLRRHEPVVLERQPKLPNNHHAVLRFRSEEVSRQLHIPFREVRVFKSCDEPDPVRAAVLYAQKVTGRYEVRSLIDLNPVTRYIAPPDLIQQMARGVDIKYDTDIDARWLAADHRPTLISTMPMPTLMDLLNYRGPRPEFVSVPGWTVNAVVSDCDMFVTRYLSSPNCSPYRISITGNMLIVEGTGDCPPDEVMVAEKAARDMGIKMSSIDAIAKHSSRYAKIGRLSASERAMAEEFMFRATIDHGIYSLGRFATWRAGLLLDDLVNDIIKIERWITKPTSAYEIHRSI